MISCKVTYTPRASSGQFVSVNVVPGLKDGINEWNRQVFELSQSLVPVDTEELKASGKVIEAEDTEKTVRGGVRYTADHAMFVEFGTGVRGRGTYPYTLPNTGAPITGTWVYDYKGVNWPGHVAQPYIRPAFDEMTDKARDILAKALSVSMQVK